MTRTALVVAVAAFAAALVCQVAWGRGAASAAGSQPCKETTAGGAAIWVYCGPAKAKVSFGGKSYAFTGGRCGIEKGSLVEGWGIGVGRYTVPPGKPKFRYFGAAWVGKTPKAGTYKKGEFVITFHLPGRTYTVIGSPLGSPLMTTKVTAGAKKGTFTGRIGGNGPKISGSWSC